jgi:hypothetical protein
LKTVHVNNTREEGKKAKGSKHMVITSQAMRRHKTTRGKEERERGKNDKSPIKFLRRK